MDSAPFRGCCTSHPKIPLEHFGHKIIRTGWMKSKKLNGASQARGDDHRTSESEDAPTRCTMLETRCASWWPNVLHWGDSKKRFTGWIFTLQTTSNESELVSKCTFHELDPRASKIFRVILFGSPFLNLILNLVNPKNSRTSAISFMVRCDWTRSTCNRLNRTNCYLPISSNLFISNVSSPYSLLKRCARSPGLSTI